MSTDDYGHLAYLVLLGCVLVFWFLAQNRNSLGKTLQIADADQKAVKRMLPYS